jgi:hypothetical protein
MPRINFEIVFEWDPRKAQTNLSKHRVNFQAAASVFADELLVSLPDAAHNERWITLGKDASGRLLVVVHTWSDTNSTSASVRIISARPATRHERRQYENSL